MPSCNLAETVHNKWKQQSGKRGDDLYVATVDDYVRAFLQVVAYYQYLKGSAGGSGPDKEELKLRIAQRKARHTGDPSVLKKPMLDMPGADEFCTREPHLEGEEVFGSTKRRLDLPLGAEEESHRPDKVNFSHPRRSHRFKRPRADDGSFEGNVAELSPAALPKVVTPPASPEATLSPIPQGGVLHVTAVEETKCDVRQWHIARLPKNSLKACFADHALTKTKCTAKIVQGNKSTPAPTYNGLMRRTFQDNEIKGMQFFFCPDDIDRCVKGFKRQWVVRFSKDQEKPPIPKVWPVKVGTSLSRKEVLSLEAAGFQLPQKQHVSPRRLFGTGRNPVDLSAYPPPSDPDVFLKKRGGRLVRRPEAPSKKNLNAVDSARALTTQIRKVTMIPPRGFGCVVTMDSGKGSNVKRYEVTISSLPECTCPFFKEQAHKIGKKGGFTYCKHLYFIFMRVCLRDPFVDFFMHAPTLSFNEVKILLESGILTHPIQ